MLGIWLVLKGNLLVADGGAAADPREDHPKIARPIAAAVPQPMKFRRRLMFGSPL
jgi:hypothetical protein